LKYYLLYEFHWLKTGLGMYFTVLTPLRIKRTRKTYPGDVVLTT
jgi:hypothetical protein